MDVVDRSDLAAVGENKTTTEVHTLRTTSSIGTLRSAPAAYSTVHPGGDHTLRSVIIAQAPKVDSLASSGIGTSTNGVDSSAALVLASCAADRLR